MCFLKFQISSVFLLHQRYCIVSLMPRETWWTARRAFKRHEMCIGWRHRAWKHYVTYVCTVAQRDWNLKASVTRERDTVSSRNRSQRRRTGRNVEWQKLQIVFMRAAYAWRDQAAAFLEPHVAFLHYFLTDLSAELEMKLLGQKGKKKGPCKVSQLLVAQKPWNK